MKEWKRFNNEKPYENPSAFGEEKEIKFSWCSNSFPMENPRVAEQISIFTTKLKLRHNPKYHNAM